MRGPLHLVGGGVRTAQQAANLGSQILEAGPAVLATVAGLLGRVDALLGQAETAVDEIRLTRARAEQVISGAERAIAAVREVTAGADGAIGSVRDVTARAGDAIDGVGVVSDRADALLGRVEPLVTTGERALAPLASDELGRALATAVRLLAGVPDELVARLPALLRSLADVLDADADTVVARLVREAPDLLDQLDDVVIPGYRLFQDVVPEITALRELAERLEPVALDVSARLAGLPGMKRAKKRGLEDPQVHAAVETLHANDVADEARAARDPAHDHGPKGIPTR